MTSFHFLPPRCDTCFTQVAQKCDSQAVATCKLQPPPLTRSLLRPCLLPNVCSAGAGAAAPAVGGAGAPPAAGGAKAPVKRAPNRLIVDESTGDDNSAVQVNSARMAELELFDGGTISIKGKRGKETIAVVLGDDSVDPNMIRMNKVRHAGKTDSGWERFPAGVVQIVFLAAVFDAMLHQCLPSRRRLCTPVAADRAQEPACASG